MSITGQMKQMQGMLKALENPQQMLSQQMMQQLIRENPDKWAAAQRMFQGKNHKQQVSALRDLYRSKGMDLDAVAKQYGITL